jgi:hypothetical protein
MGALAARRGAGAGLALRTGVAGACLVRAARTLSRQPQSSALAEWGPTRAMAIRLADASKLYLKTLSFVSKACRGASDARFNMGRSISGQVEPPAGSRALVNAKRP